MEHDNAFLRSTLRNSDWAITLAALVTTDLAEAPEVLDLVCAFVELRAGGAREDKLHAWGARARAFLLELIGEKADAAKLY